MKSAQTPVGPRPSGSEAPVEEDPEVVRLLEQLRTETDRGKKVRILKELVQKDRYLTDEMLQVAFARLLSRLKEAD